MDQVSPAPHVLRDDEWLRDTPHRAFELRREEVAPPSRVLGARIQVAGCPPAGLVAARRVRRDPAADQTRRMARSGQFRSAVRACASSFGGTSSCWRTLLPSSSALNTSGASMWQRPWPLHRFRSMMTFIGLPLDVRVQDQRSGRFLTPKWIPAYPVAWPSSR